MILGPILRQSIRSIRKRPLQPLLGLCAIAMGTAVVVGVDTANRSATAAFDEAVTVLSGSATHSLVGGPTGIDESWLARLRSDLGIRSATPLLEGSGRILRDERPTDTLRIRGVDPLIEGQLRPWFDAQPGGSTLSLGELMTDPRAAVLSSRTADRLGLGVDDEFLIRVAGRTVDLRVSDLLRSEDPSTARALDEVLWLDLSTAQEVLDRRGRLDRIDLALSPDGAETLRASLPPDLRLEDAGAEQGALGRLTRAFRFNLAALAALALLVGAFLIHQAIQFRVVQRRQSFAILRAIGATRAQILRSVLAEAALLSGLGALLGTGLGLLMADGLLSAVSTTVRELYSPFAVSSVRPSFGSLGLWALCSTLVGTIAAVPPSLEATRTHPESATRRTTIERGRGPSLRGLLVALAVLSLGLTSFFSVGLWAAYVTVLSVILGLALGVPTLTGWLLRGLRPVFALVFGVEGRLAVRGAEGGLSRTGLATAALATAVAATLGVDLMVGSFRSALDSWLGVTLNADYYASVPSHMSDRTSVRMDPDAVAALQGLDGLRGTSTYRRVELRTELGELEFAAVDATGGLWPGLDLIAGDRSAVPTVFEQNRGVLISEPLAHRNGLRVGDAIHLSDYDEDVEVLAVFRDYATERGYAMWSAASHRRVTGDDAVSSIALFAKPDVDSDQLLEEARVVANRGAQDVVVRSTPELRTASMQVFDRTFAITDVLRFLCVIVAFVGTVAALLALQLERRVELALLRAVGATRAQVARSVVWQNLALGLCAGLLAIPIGFALAFLLVELIQPRSFGWSLPGVEPDLGAVLITPLLAITAALLASPWPAMQASRTLVARNLHEE